MATTLSLSRPMYRWIPNLITPSRRFRTRLAMPKAPYRQRAHVEYVARLRSGLLADYAYLSSLPSARHARVAKVIANGNGSWPAGRVVSFVIRLHWGYNGFRRRWRRSWSAFVAATGRGKGCGWNDALCCRVSWLRQRSDACVTRLRTSSQYKTYSYIRWIDMAGHGFHEYSCNYYIDLIGLF